MNEAATGTTSETATETNALGSLPEWDLSDLYSGIDAPELAADLARAGDDATGFRERYFGKLAGLGGAALGQAVVEFEALDERLGRISSYAQLVYAGNIGNAEIGKFQQTTHEQVNEISAALVFFTLELNQLDDGALETPLKDPKLARYAPWLADMRTFRPHELAEDMERLLYEKRVSGRAAWNRLFDETMAGLRFRIRGRDLTAEEVLHRLADPDGAVRKQAARVLGKGLGKNVKLFALITNTLAKDKETEDKWRSYKAPQSSRNLGNRVEDHVVAALTDAVKSAYPGISHRYYRLKARWLGRRRLDYWDRNAPLPEADGRLIPWDEAKRIVLDAYRVFSPELAAVGSRFFENSWIDAATRPGKASGAFAHPTVPSAHPYLLLNYMGRPRDVMTLAHELGHGVHQILAAPQGQLLADTPLTLAETASVFGEMLTFRALLAAEFDPGRRKALLASKVEDMLNTVVRQIAFYDFELRVHGERSKGEITPERLCEIWLDVQTESLGPTLRFHDEYKYYWTYIPHFIHAPFYVYAYAFGDCLVNSLYAVYQDAADGFAERYLDMLRAGGSKRHRELLAPFGLDAGNAGFWARGLGVIEGLVDELEGLSS